MRITHHPHFGGRMDFDELYVMAGNDTCCHAESDLRATNTPWRGEPVPDRACLSRHLQAMPGGRMGGVLAETSRRRLEAADGVRGMPAAGSSGVKLPGTKPSEKRTWKGATLSKRAKRNIENTT